MSYPHSGQVTDAPPLLRRKPASRDAMKRTHAHTNIAGTSATKSANGALTQNESIAP